METTRETNDKILSFGTQPMAVNFPAIAQVDAYWEALRNGRLMPARAEVDPRGLAQSLEYALMLEVVGKGVARIRVAGAHMTDLLGMDVRGMPLTVFIEPNARAQISEAIENVINRPQVADIKLSNSGGIGRPQMTARLLLTPLSVRDGEKPRILACLQSKGAIGRVPRRSGVDEVLSRRIVAAADTSLDRGLTHQASARPTMAQFSEPKAAFQPAKSAPQLRSERPYLRLVKTD